MSVVSGRYLIRYTYPGTVNDKPVGDVYVARVEGAQDVYSYSKDPAEATHFVRFDAEALFVKWARNDAHLIGEEDAEVLP